MNNFYLENWRVLERKKVWNLEWKLCLFCWLWVSCTLLRVIVCGDSLRKIFQMLLQKKKEKKIEYMFYFLFSVFIYSMPGYSCSVKERMLYSSCKAPLIDLIESNLGLTISKKVIDYSCPSLNVFSLWLIVNIFTMLHFSWK